MLHTTVQCTEQAHTLHTAVQAVKVDASTTYSRSSHRYRMRYGSTSQRIRSICYIQQYNTQNRRIRYIQQYKPQKQMHPLHTTDLVIDIGACATAALVIGIGADATHNSTMHKNRSIRYIQQYKPYKQIHTQHTTDLVIGNRSMRCDSTSHINRSIQLHTTVQYTKQQHTLHTAGLTIELDAYTTYSSTVHRNSSIRFVQLFQHQK